MLTVARLPFDAAAAHGDHPALRSELTPTLKVERAVVHRNHADVFASLYE